MRFFLQNAQFRVETAGNGKDGLEIARRLQPDLILLDLHMPDMNGHQVCQALKEQGETLDIPVIMLTSASETVEKVTAFNLGIADYLCKAAPLEEMLARIKSAINKNTGADDPGFESRSKDVLLLREMIAHQNVRVLFQPIVKMSSREVIAYEALARGPKGSALENAANLFSLAAESGLFGPLDSVCRQIAVRHATFLRPGMLLFLNTDANALADESFLRLEFLAGTHVQPSQVCLEITERMYIKSFNTVKEKLAELKTRGVRFAIDDVGDGYSSLRAIAEFEPDYLKIDISLVRNIQNDKLKTVLVQTILGLSEKLGNLTIAEGIETEEEYKTLLDLGVQLGQGYLFGRPAEHGLQR